ncbi:heavy metal-associated isoprenylated plant protein 39 [Malania oleifera]|uniref:heavy metal-associated isoprenylated plant protein 39 n=1 Tax=Malania oleifera TaxID=397392 RepID=UPI0025ADD166|nr:heavy metal-associated isoprenylated plant protein 39 [Malania oleifera]
MAMKKVILRLDIYDDKAKRNALKTVSTIPGIESIAMDMKERKLTVIGAVDPVCLVARLRKKKWQAEIFSVGPKEEKKDGGDKKKDEGKKDEGKKDDVKKKEEQIAELVKAYKAYNPHMTQYYYVESAEEDPNACVIC